MSDAIKRIYLPNGECKRLDATSLTTEIANRQNAGLSQYDMNLWFNHLPDPDTVLRKRGDDAVILTELLADDQVTTAILARKNRVLNSPHFAFRAGAPDGETATPEATLLYKRLTQDLEHVNMRTIISGILDAPFFGMTPLELIWCAYDGWWHIQDIVPRPYHWFAFDHSNQPFFCGEHGWACTDPTPLPHGKFIIVSHHATYDNPYGLRLLSRCLWPVTFKRGGLQFYAKFVERHGMPWVAGTAPPKATREEKRLMAHDLARMVQDCVSVLPAGANLQFLAPVVGQDIFYERFLSRQDKSISKLLMGQTLTVEMDGRNNSQAAAITHDEVAEGIADADKAMVADTFNEIAWLYKQLNMGADVYAPIFSYEEPADLLARAALDKCLCEMGVEFTEEHYTDNYNLKKTEFTLRPPQTGVPSFTFSAPKDTSPVVKEITSETLAEQAQTGLDVSIVNLLPEALKANEEFVKSLAKSIQDATSFDEIQFALAKVLTPRLTPSSLEKIMYEAMLAAAGYGAATVHSEATEDSSMPSIKHY